MRNQFICEIPDSVRDTLSRQAVEQLDTLFDAIDSEEPCQDDDDVDALWGLRQLMN